MNLIKTLKDSKYARKIFGKKEIVIIEKQVMGVNLTPSEKTRLSRDIRKKFNVILELSKYADEFNLKKGQVVKELIDNAKEAILESKYCSKIKRIILFGSAVENQLTYRSDIDMAVVFSQINKKESDEFRIRTLGRINNRIDLQVYNILPAKIKKEIDEKGKVIWKKE